MSIAEYTSEQITRSLKREWLFNQRVVTYRPVDITGYTLNAWKNALAQNLKAWQPNIPFLALFDFQDIIAPLDSVASSELNRIFQVLQKSTLAGNLAIVIARTADEATEALYMAINRALEFHARTIEGKFFPDRQTAFEWLLNNPIRKHR